MSIDINVGDFLATRAHLNPNKEGLVDLHNNRRLSFGELNQRSNQCVNGLLSLGLEKGERTALLANNSHHFLESFFGPIKSGLVVMPLNWRLTAEELAFILKDGGAKALVFDAEFTAVVEELRAMGDKGSDIEHWICIGDNTPEYAIDYEQLLADASSSEPTVKAEADDNLFIMYTSGTTGHPKGVVHTHNTVLWTMLTSNVSYDILLEDRYLLMLPMFHVGALAPAIGSIYNGSTLVLLRTFDPTTAWEQIEKERISTTLAVPAMLTFMLQVPDFQRFDCSSLRFVASGAAPVPVSLINTYTDMGIQIAQVYGMTETCGPACVITADDAVRKAGSTGKSFFHTQVRIVDDNGNEQPPGVAGEVVVRGPHIMKEYWNRPEATAETIVDGWLHTGDIATRDEEGFITIADRKKDMIISGGENVYPAEIENVLLQHEDIVDVAVIGQGSAKWGESPLAVVVRGHDNLTEHQVLSFCDGKLARFKKPKGCVFVDVIPRNPSGKILKRVLRDQFPDPASE